MQQFDLAVGEFVESGEPVLSIVEAAEIGVAVLHFAGLQFVD